MEKIKINLASGTMLEKPLLTAFKNNELSYVVLDNELNGTMGLPIILVSKLEENKLVKIADKSPEWETVKEALRKIISGSQIEYITPEMNLAADDLFFSQLTLPIASFESLKNNYKPVEQNIETQVQTAEPEPAPVTNETFEQSENITQPIEPTIDNPVNPIEETPVPEVESQPLPSTPLSPIEMVQREIDKVIESTPEVNETPVMPSTIDLPTIEAPTSPVEPSPVNNQEVASVPTTPNTEAITNIPEEPSKQLPDLTADKEAFLKACENMFDALVAKLKNINRS